MLANAYGWQTDNLTLRIIGIPQQIEGRYIQK